MPSSRLIGVGVFVIGGILLFTAGLFLIGDRRGLFADNFEIYAEFGKLAGLENGATVRVAGMDAGEVIAIHVPTRPGAKFRVRLRIRESLHGVVRSDSVASIQTEGLVGNKFLQIEAGSDQSPPAPDGSTIQSREPFDMADLLLQMSDTLKLVNDTVETLQGDVQKAVRAVSDAAVEGRDIVLRARDDVEALLQDSRRIARDIRAISGDISGGRGTIGKLVTDDELYAQARNVAVEAERVVAELREAARGAKTAIEDFRGQGEGAAQGIAGDLRETLAHARDAMASLAENAEALKRNFLFRGYFNRRGYFSLDDLSVDEYRAGALESGDRRPLRIWLGAEVLFETDANGVEVLTEDGKARIDSAMSQFLRYPPDSPLIVEGYADEPTADARFLIGRRRATLVREHILSRFRLDSGRVAVMMLGADAPGSPSGSTWRGVALALFAPR
jgi:phospholipid/cholesterol/gamma-HCH transport system substrate-binding protein